MVNETEPKGLGFIPVSGSANEDQTVVRKVRESLLNRRIARIAEIDLKNTKTRHNGSIDAWIAADGAGLFVLISRYPEINYLVLPAVITAAIGLGLYALRRIQLNTYQRELNDLKNQRNHLINLINPQTTNE